MKISVSKDSQWDIAAYAKAPLELLLCESLHPTSKLLWIVLANQANFGPIDKSVLDRRIGIHRSTRIRCLNELTEVGLISGTDAKIIVHNPSPILRSIKEADNIAREEVWNQLCGDLEPVIEQPKKPAIKPKAKQLSEDEKCKLAADAWNLFRPSNYTKINKMSSKLLECIDLHIAALGLTKGAYEEFFSVLKSGVEHSPFWAKENSCKTLQSIIGIGSPQTKKYQNVYQLYNEGLNYDKSSATQEEDRKDEIVIKAEYRKLIDEYDELQFMYWNLENNEPDNVDILAPRITNTENLLRKAKLDPARFRMKYGLNTWPSDVPEPAAPRERFWKYDDEK